MTTLTKTSAKSYETKDGGFRVTKHVERGFNGGAAFRAPVTWTLDGLIDGRFEALALCQTLDDARAKIDAVIAEGGAADYLARVKAEMRAARAARRAARAAAKN